MPVPLTSKKNNRTYQKGQFAELISCIYLIFKGFRILKWRYKHPLGEIDIIAKRRDLLIFVEVKYRETEGKAIEAIRFNQRRRIEKASQVYLRSSKIRSGRMRFDAILITKRLFPVHIKQAWLFGE